jgi:hypothetical protein
MLEGQGLDQLRYARAGGVFSCVHGGVPFNIHWCQITDVSATGIYGQSAAVVYGNSAALYKG